MDTSADVSERAAGLCGWRITATVWSQLDEVRISVPGAGLQGCTDAGLARLLTRAGEADLGGCGGASRLGRFESFLWVGGNSRVRLVGAGWKDEGGGDCGCGSRAEEKRSELEMG